MGSKSQTTKKTTTLSKEDSASEITIQGDVKVEQIEPKPRPTTAIASDCCLPQCLTEHTIPNNAIE